MAHKTNTKACRFAHAVTVHTPISLGGTDLFAVQAGIPMGEALDAMALLLSTTESAACEAAISAGGDGNIQGTAWALQHLLLLATALNSSIHSGVIAAQKAERTTTSGGS